MLKKNKMGVLLKPKEISSSNKTTQDLEIMMSKNLIYLFKKTRKDKNFQKVRTKINYLELRASLKLKL